MIANRIYEWARSQPTKPAVISSDHDHTSSYADFARAIECARRFFELQGLPAGQTAIVLSSNLFDDWVRVMALRALGLNTVCVRSVEVAAAVKLRNVACLVMFEATQHAPKFNGTSLEGIKVIMVPRAIFSHVRTGDPPLPPHRAPPFGGHILLTSGTTGTYKKVFFDGAYEDRRNQVWVHELRFNNKSIYHVRNLALWSGVGFKVPSAVWQVGGCVVMTARPTEFFRYPIDFSIIGPAALKELLRSLDTGSTHDNCELMVGGGFLPLELAEETVRRVTRKLGILYSSTELAAPALLSRRGASPDMYWLAPAANRTIRIVDENGNECPQGQEGQLCIQIMDIDCKSYLDDEETTAKMFRDGFFYPGDLAVSRADGCVRILGRIADVLNVRGQKLAVAPMELAVQRMLGVDEVCLFYGLNKGGHEELVIAIQGDAMPPKSVLDQVAREFPSFERIRVQFFKEFPRSATGLRKTRRSVLRKLVFPEPGEMSRAEAQLE
jgi:acyl-CoA synthetase (AMP-forming)/AMP-acid ligase II